MLILLTSCVAFLYYTWDINSWKFAFVGDDWQFYAFARDIAQGAIHVNPLDMHGVYGYNGVLGSVYQAAFLRVLGPSNLAWRLSNLVLVVPMSVCFYLWLRMSFSPRVALLGTLILQASSFIANYLKIGYINAQAFALFILALYLAARFGQRPSVWISVLLGATLGISFYIYLGPIFPALVVPYALQPLFDRHHPRPQLLLSAACGLATYAIVALPGVLSAAQFDPTVRGTTVLGAQPRDAQQIFTSILHNLLLFYQTYDYYFNHFIAGSYLDVISGVLAAVGIVLVLIRVRSGPFLRLALTYVLVVVVIALTSPYPYAATTRGIFFIPFGAAFAALGLDALLRLLLQRVSTPLLAPTLAAVLLAAIWGTNIYQSQVGVFASTGYSATALVVRAMQEEAQRPNPQVLVLVVSREYAYHGYYGNDRFLPMLQQAYGLQHIELIVAEPASLRCDILSDTRVLYFQPDSTAADAIQAFSCPAGISYATDVLTPAYPL